MSEATPHLLVVDDDARIRDLLARFLRKSGYLVTAAPDVAVARRLMGGLAFDLVVLDVMLPGEDGLAFCRALRGRVPVILLTARGGTDERIAGLEAGADDYLAKPFEPKELVLRLGAILRRAQAEPVSPAQPEGQPIRLGRWTYRPGATDLRGADGEVLRLTATEAALMKALTAEPGVAVARHLLGADEEEGTDRSGSDRPGSGGAGSDRAIDVQMTRLRRKIEPDPREPRYLQTVRGLGYRLVPDAT